jgi:phosphoglycerate dehydrogenase-like enzyme
LSSAAAAPALAVSDRIAEFLPPPDRIRILTAVAQSVVPAPQYNAAEIKQITSQGKNVELILPKSADEMNKALAEVDGMTAGIVGMGGIGQFTASKLHAAFNMKILATDAQPMPKPFFVDTLREPGWFMEMVPQVDILVGAAPATSPLFDSPNLVLTCHTGGFAPQRRIRLMGLLADNVRRYSNGLPLLNVVDKVRGY